MSDRERLLLEGAKQEGKVVWYTTLAADQNKQIANAFETKYPGVKVETFRTGSSALAQRVLTEAKARRHLVDAIETTLPGLLTFRDNQLLLPYTSPHLAGYSEDSREKAPKNLVYWTIDRESFIGFGYNKNFLAAADVPKNFDGLMRPALRDNMGLSGDDTGARIVGAMLRAKGEGFLKKLKEQNIRMHMMAGSALTQLVAAGEIFASPSQFYSATNVAAKRGAPVAWVPMDLVVTNAGGAAVYAHVQRPHAALLFADFLLGPDAQKLLEELYFGSASEGLWVQTLVSGKRWLGHPVRRSTGRVAQTAQGTYPKIIDDGRTFKSFQTFKTFKPFKYRHKPRKGDRGISLGASGHRDVEPR